MGAGAAVAGSWGARPSGAVVGSLVVRQFAEGPSSRAQAPRANAKPSATISFDRPSIRPDHRRAVSLTMLI